MTWSETAILIVAVLVVFGVITWQFATRLDRLHRKVAASRIALDAQLVRRSSAARELAGSGELDPASSIIIVDAVAATGRSAAADPGASELLMAVPDLAAKVSSRAPAPDGAPSPCASRPVISQVLAAGLGYERAMAESNLSATLRAALIDPEDVAEIVETPEGSQLIDDLAMSWYRVQLARRFHNEAVAQAQRVRRKRLVRMLRLAGRAAMPQMVELDDAWPPSLGHAGDHGRGV